jgi:dihydrofolate reductase
MRSAVHAGPSQQATKEDRMGRIVVTEFISLDGVMQAPGGEDFKYKGWTFEFDRGDDGNQFKLDEVLEADAHLLGRVTYESFAGAWPERESAPGDLGKFAKKLRDDPKYLVSTKLTDPDWENTIVLDSGDATAQVEKLKDEVDGTILVSGSRRLVQELLDSDLIDQVNLMVFPVALGTGDRMFGEMGDRKTFKLIESRPVGSEGVLVHKFERVRD